MSTSPAPTIPASECRPDIFDQLSQCERLLTAKELASMLAISPKTIYSYVERNMIPYYRIEANIRFRARDSQTGCGIVRSRVLRCRSRQGPRRPESAQPAWR